ncbi:MAG: glucose-6-phosphate isomerase, partial [Acidobacteria bacterium]
MTKLIDRPEWRALQRHYNQISTLHLRDLFAKDPDRASRFSLEEEGILLDYSKNRMTEETIGLLVALARAVDLPREIERMFGGEKINFTEKRAVLHTALRNRSDAPVLVDGQDVMPQVRRVLDKMASFSRRIRTGEWKGQTGKPIRTVINIGIGGSDLGPAMACEALRPYTDRRLSVRFVSNVDATHLSEALRDAQPEETLFIVASKTFTTQETMAN